MIEAVIWDFGGVFTTSPFEAFARYERAHGIPVGTLAIGKAGAINAALLAAAVLALSDEEIADRLDEWRERQSAAVAEYPMDDL